MAIRTVKEHYNQHLAEHYSWAFGGRAARTADNRRTFETLGVRPSGSNRALDLGCGSGFQSLALADLGFDVTALDISERLLAELDGASQGRVATRNEDIVRFVDEAAPGSFTLAVCMGDTLTHLSSFAEVERLVRGVRRVLEPGGRFLLGFRDLTLERIGTDRFIPVRADADAILTCFLEYAADHVVVHDLLYTRSEQWQLRTSAYAKLRLDGPTIARTLVDAGFAGVTHETAAGVVRIDARSA